MGTTGRTPTTMDARTARRGAAAALSGLLLTGCAGPGPTPDPPGSPVPSAAAPTAMASPSAPSATAASGPWGAYPGRGEACAAVAEDLVALALLPASLSGGPTTEQVHAVEDQVAGMLAAAPPELAADHARVQLLVDSYGEELAEDPDARFDGEALDEALAPVRDWLDGTCRDTR